MSVESPGEMNQLINKVFEDGEFRRRFLSNPGAAAASIGIHMGEADLRDLHAAMERARARRWNQTDAKSEDSDLVDYW